MRSQSKNKKNSRNLSRRLRDYLIDQGCDLVGFGEVERLDGAPDIMQPRRYMPDASTLVSIGLRINNASCDLIKKSVKDRKAPPSYYSYQVFTLGIINPQLDKLSYLGAKFLEKRGYSAYPIPANMPHLQKPTKEYPGGPGDLSHKHVAVASGVGEIGWHNLVMTPQYGARQKLTSIVTNAPIKPDPMLDKRLCDPVSCGFKCSEACPTGAIPADLDKKAVIEIGDKEVEYAKIVGWKCRWGCSGMLKITGGYSNIPLPAKEPGPDEYLEYKKKVDPWQERLKLYSGLLPYCGRCLSVCPVPGDAD
jgi:epoxyqueuosine reductase QueG